VNSAHEETPRLGATGSPLGGIWRVWSGPAPTAAAQLLVVLAAASLFLQSAATLQVIYTFRASYLLSTLAVAVGLPYVVAGWRALPSWLGFWAGALVAFYIAADLFGDKAVLQGSARGGSHRDLVFMADLLLGLGLVGLMAGIARKERAVRRILTGLAAGVALAAVYGAYQWFAQHFGWPLQDVNNTMDSNGITTDTAQGVGVLGWERIRGTFLEPHFLGEFLAAGLPLLAYAAWRARGAPRWVAFLAVVASLFALLMTASVPAWAVLTVAVLFAATSWAFGRGRRRLGAAGAAVLVVIVVGAPLAAASPHVVARVTGRSPSEITVTTAARTETWARVLNEWSARPLLGYGPGQSPVRLAQDSAPIAGEKRPAKVLVSAQGAWSAALLDAGILGFGAWVYLLGGIVVICATALVRHPDGIRTASVAALTAMVLGAQLSGDRLEIGTWLVVGFALAVASLSPAQRDHRQPAE
jgi:O-antigen ligase